MALADFGVMVSPNTVARLLHQRGYSLRVNHKRLATSHSPDRNDQFLYLCDLRSQFQRQGHPIISVDTKKRELVGPFNLKTAVAHRLWRLEADGRPVHRWGEGKGSYDGAEDETPSIQGLQLLRD